MQKLKSSQSTQSKEYFLNKSHSLKSFESAQKNLSSSIISNKSKAQFQNKVVKHYNDRKKDYMNQSRSLSERSFNYQTKQISSSKMKRYNQQKIQNIVQNRSKTQVQSKLTNKTMSLPMMKLMDKDVVKSRISSLNARKFSQLISGTKSIEKNVKKLNKQIQQRRQSSSYQKKWASPFRETNMFKKNFEGKNLVPKKVEGILANSNSTQLKVLNLDRMFRMKNGKFGNVVPIPLARLSSLSSRENLSKTIKKKDSIHHIIQEYNNLLKISKMQKQIKKIGVRGHNFTKSPTLQELMGIKIHEYRRKNEKQFEEQELDEEIFFKYCQFYSKNMRKDIHLSRRIISGLKMTGKFNLEAFIRFYSIFVNKISSNTEKIQFLQYFFIPLGQDKVELDILKLILEIMCQELPQINSLKQQSQFLTKEEKSKIFLEALNRVLFSTLNPPEKEQKTFINRSILQIILQKNEDAATLLIRLLTLQ